MTGAQVAAATGATFRFFRRPARIAHAEGAAGRGSRDCQRMVRSYLLYVTSPNRIRAGFTNDTAVGLAGRRLSHRKRCSSRRQVSVKRCLIITEDAMHGVCGVRARTAQFRGRTCSIYPAKKKKQEATITLLPVECLQLLASDCSFLQHKSCELVLIVDDDASLLNANIDGVLAVIVPHAISLAAAFHLFAPAWWHADLNINALSERNSRMDRHRHTDH